MVEQVEAVVIGAGVVGLAVARALALAGQEVLVLEAEASIGTVTSSRNSEVIHAGISVYTAFMAFGSVRIFPALALHPAMWSVPLTLGVGTIIYHWRVLDRRFARIGARKEVLF